MKKIPLVIMGAGGFAREVLNWVDYEKYDLVAMYSDKAEPGQTILRVPVVSNLEQFKGAHFTAGVGDPKTRLMLTGDAIRSGLCRADPIIHKSAIIGTNVRIGDGSVICPNAVITTDCDLGTDVIVNLGATIGHDCKVESYVTISPGANISGRCVVKEFSYIGTNAALRESLEIGVYSVLGMGAVLTKNMGDGEIWFGNPARPIS